MYISGHESSLSAGDAVCAFNGTGYSLDGSRVKLDETVLCDTSASLISKRDGPAQEVNSTPTTTITVTVYESTHTQAKTQIPSVDTTIPVKLSPWPEYGYTPTVITTGSSTSSAETQVSSVDTSIPVSSDPWTESEYTTTISISAMASANPSSVELETLAVDSITSICSNPWPKSGPTATAVTVMPGNSSTVSSTSSTTPGEDINNEETMPTFQPHVFMETSVGTASSNRSPYPTITTAIVTEKQTETGSSNTPTDEPSRETEFEPVPFKHSESESTRPWMIVSEEQDIATVSGEKLTTIALLLVNEYTPAILDTGRPIITLEMPFTALDTFTPSETETIRPWMIVDREEDVITVSGQKLTGTALIVTNKLAAATASREKQMVTNTRTGKGTSASSSSSSFETWTGVDLDRPNQTTSTTHSSSGAKVSGLDEGLFMFGLILVVCCMFIRV